MSEIHAPAAGPTDPRPYAGRRLGRIATREHVGADGFWSPDASP